MKTLEEQGFYVEHTGGNCTAWAKKLPSGQYIVLTCGGGCDHRFTNDLLIGIYDGSEGDLWGELIDSFEIDLDKGGKDMKEEKAFGELYGDTYPTDKDLPIDVIEHHAQAHNLIASDDLLMFARALWTEGKLS